MKIRAIADIHIGSTIAINTFEEVLGAIDFAPSDTLVCYLGDNIDFKNASPKDLPELHVQHDRLKEAITRRKGIFVSGNECLPIFLSGNHDPTQVVFQVRDNILFVHGDYPFWGFNRSSTFRNKPEGAGFFRRYVIVPLIQWGRGFLDAGPNADFIEFIKTMTEQTVVCGHRHPIENIIGEVNGKKYFILKRGIQDIVVA